jgi:hypothetical protein
MNFAVGQRVVILSARHPHRLKAGTLVGRDLLPVLGEWRWRVRLDGTPGAGVTQECCARDEDLEPLGRECPQCGAAMSHFRLLGYQCPRGCQA